MSRARKNRKLRGGAMTAAQEQARDAAMADMIAKMSPAQLQQLIGQIKQYLEYTAKLPTQQRTSVIIEGEDYSKKALVKVEDEYAKKTAAAASPGGQAALAASAAMAATRASSAATASPGAPANPVTATPNDQAVWTLIDSLTRQAVITQTSFQKVLMDTKEELSVVKRLATVLKDPSVKGLITTALQKIN